MAQDLLASDFLSCYEKEKPEVKLRTLSRLFPLREKREQVR
jgi:hypothetical protein